MKVTTYLLSTALLVFACVSAGGILLAQSSEDYRSGFTRYARVDRGDGTYREMLIENKALAAIREGNGPPPGTTILMETYYRPGEVSTIFAERYDGRSWRYGSFYSGDPLPMFRNDVSCSSCHQRAEPTEMIFTLPMVRRFSTTGKIQTTFCELSGRAPCSAKTYSEPHGQSG